ncbi:phage structural protein [Ureibacillus suwonensis]|uniref:Phage structural protein n=1 Tax=Ureibacillus suwonensis TaxID=313007 RepID=A0ABW0RAF4_9BACL
MGTYDARKVVTTVDGVIITGYSDGSMVKASKDNDNFEASSSAQGDSIITINGDSLGTIEITLNQTSPSISYLDQLANERKIVPVWVNSNNEVKEVVGGTQGIVTKPADKEFGKSATNRTYTIKVLDYTVK